jgi:hypothetical protein
VRLDPPLLEATVDAATRITGRSMCSTPVRMTIADGGGILERLTRMVEPIRIRLEGGSGRKTTVKRRQITDAQRKLTEPFLPIGKYGP